MWCLLQHLTPLGEQNPQLSISNWGIFIVSLFTVLTEAGSWSVSDTPSWRSQQTFKLLCETLRACFAMTFPWPGRSQNSTSHRFLLCPGDCSILSIRNEILKHLQSQWQTFSREKFYNHHLVYYEGSRSSISENHFENSVFKDFIIFSLVTT